MTPEQSPVPAADFIVKAHTESYRTKELSAEISFITPLEQTLTDSLAIFKDDEQNHERYAFIPAAVTSVGKGIAQAVFTYERIHPNSVDQRLYLPDKLVKDFDQWHIQPVHFLVGRLARDVLENTDSHRLLVQERYAHKHESKYFKFYDKETIEVIKNIQQYVTNNDGLLLVPSRNQAGFIDELQKSIHTQFASEGTSQICDISHTMHEFAQPGLSILQTTITGEFGKWNNYTILMDPDYDLKHDKRTGPQFSLFENLSLLIGYNEKEDEMVHVMTTAWCLNRRYLDRNISIEDPSGYPTIWDWFNTVTRMTYQINRHLNVYGSDKFEHVMSNNVDEHTLSGLRSEFRRLTTGHNSGTIDPSHRREIVQQLTTMIEMNTESTVKILDRLDALPAIIHAFGGNPYEVNRQDLAREILNDINEIAHHSSGTNVQEFIAGIQTFCKKHGYAKREVLPDVDALFYMMDELTKGHDIMPARRRLAEVAQSP